MTLKSIKRPAKLMLLSFAVLSGLALVPSSQATAATPCVDRTFRYGSRDVCVGYIQNLFNASVHGGSNNFIGVDNSYGPQTTGAIQFFQTRTGLQVDGITGPNTWRQLCFRGGNNGYFTKDVQQYGLNAAVNAGCQKYGRPTVPFPLPL